MILVKLTNRNHRCKPILPIISGISHWYSYLRDLSLYSSLILSALYTPSRFYNRKHLNKFLMKNEEIFYKRKTQMKAFTDMAGNANFVWENTLPEVGLSLSMVNFFEFFLLTCFWFSVGTKTFNTWLNHSVALGKIKLIS